MYTVEDLLNVMVKGQASDLYISLGAYPMLKISGETLPLKKVKVTAEILESFKNSLLNEEQIQVFNQKRELDFAYSLPGVGRFRVNCFRQRSSDSFVIRLITTKVQSASELGLPPLLNDLALKERGLILVVGSTGSGKSTTLAAMIDHRNSKSSGHILTLEDPIEFLHPHKKSIINQREIGDDSDSFNAALKSALRESPSLLLIGEIRDGETMSAALNFAETGHLVLSTLHAANAYQTLERILSFFEPSMQEVIKLQLSQNLQAVVAQRLVPAVQEGRVAALEILLATARVKDLIHKGEIELLRHTIESSRMEGMQSFDQCLYDYFKAGKISEETALQYSDRPTNLKLLIRSKEEVVLYRKIELDD